MFKKVRIYLQLVRFPPECWGPLLNMALGTGSTSESSSENSSGNVCGPLWLRALESSIAWMAICSSVSSLSCSIASCLRLTILLNLFRSTFKKRTSLIFYTFVQVKCDNYCLPFDYFLFNLIYSLFCFMQLIEFDVYWIVNFLFLRKFIYTLVIQLKFIFNKIINSIKY